MPEYKKKNVKKTRRQVKNTYTDDIPMTPKKPKKVKTQTEKPVKKTVSSSKMRLIRGNRLKFKRRRNIFTLCALFLIAAVVITSLSLPTGILEFMQNKIAAVGDASGYPGTFAGGELINVVENDDIFITVTPTEIGGYNSKSGKNVFKYQHGFERPLIAASPARFIVFSQGDTRYSVYNYSKMLINGETENDILNAVIGRGGTFAIATQSDGYSSEVAVYNKQGNRIYTWQCADYIINDLLLSNDGKKLIVSAINAKDGYFVSKLYVLKFDTATPVFSETFDGDMLLDLSSKNSRTFNAVFENHIEFYRWKDFTKTTFESEKQIYFNRATSKYNLFVAGHDGNKSDNTLYIYNKKGEQAYSFDFAGEITDISLTGNYIHILSGKNVYLYSVKGEEISCEPCDFGVSRIVPINHHTAALLTDNNMSKINLE